MLDDAELVILMQAICSGICCFMVILLGYLSGSKYAIMGAVRAVVSEVSNDTTSLLVNATVYAFASGLSYESLYFTQTTVLFIFVLPFLLIISLFHLFIAAQRSPLDLIEVEGELVAGYNIEFSGADVLVIYFSEYFHLFNAAFQFSYFLVGALTLSSVVFGTVLVGVEPGFILG